MYQQDEYNILKQKKWTDLSLIDPKIIDTMLFDELVVKVGEHRLLDLLNAKLNNPRFEVKFIFDDVKGTLASEGLSDPIRGVYLALFYHEFTIPKPTLIRGGEIFRELEEAFQVDHVIEDDDIVTFQVGFGMSPLANTIEETIDNIHQILGPDVESIAKKLGIDDYHMTFLIDLGY